MDSMTEKMRKAYGSVLEKLRTNSLGSAASSKPADVPVTPQPVKEKPTKLEHIPGRPQPPPTVAGPTPGGHYSSLPQPRKSPPASVVTPAPTIPKPPTLSIHAIKPETARKPEPMPAERLAAKVSNSQLESLHTLAKTRLAATKGLDRLGDKSRQLFPDQEPER